MSPSAGFLDHPLVLFPVSVFVLGGAAAAAVALRKRDLNDTEQADIGLIVGATLTLLGLIIGFSFSMATSRYDQRKNLEEGEANAIGTEYVRADLLPRADARKADGLLRAYLDARIHFYADRDARILDETTARTAALQSDLWAAVRQAALDKPTPVNALVLSGMNDVLNAQGYTEAAWRNRIPVAAWGLMILIALCSSALVGYSSHRTRERPIVILIVPVLASVAFLLIADLDSPRGGLINVRPDNLTSLAVSLRNP